ncbi:MAG TPA: hypothetical protein VN877_05300, partial [Opitutaceae bacterium]|nr:hypothetical protein [Opitutaceae bacterium]
PWRSASSRTGTYSAGPGSGRPSPSSARSSSGSSGWAPPRTPRRRTGAFLGLCLACLAQSYGLVLFLNCDFDRSVPAIHRTEVVSRRISTGKHTSYYVSLGPWLGGQDEEEVSVGRSFYEAHSEGSVVLVGVRGGALSMPWYFLQ